MLGFGLAIEPQLWTLIFVMIRVGAAFVAAPVFGNVSVPLPGVLDHVSLETSKSRG